MTPHAPTTEYIVLHLLCPSLGVILATLTFAAPISALRNRLAHGTLGHLNPTPWAVMTGNCAGWIGYSFVTKDLFVLMANVPGLMVSIWLNVGACQLQYREYYELKLRDRPLGNNADNGRAVLLLASSPSGSSNRNIIASSSNEDESTGQRSDGDHEYDVEIASVHVPSTVPHERKVLWVLLTWVTIFSLVAHVQLTNYVREQIIGYIVNVNLCFFYFAPLTTIFEVCRTRSSASIHVRTTVMTVLNSFFWLAYGGAVGDPFIYVPNGIGLLFGLMQSLLLVVFGTKRNSSADDARESLIGDDGEEEVAGDDSTGADCFDNDGEGLV